MRPVHRDGNPVGVVHTVIRADDCEDTGVGIVVSRRPLTLLVPSHLILLVEQGRAESVLINGKVFPTAKIMPSRALQGDHLALLRLSGGTARASHVKLPRRSRRLTEGQQIALIGADGSSHRGRVADIIERGDGMSVVTDINVEPGASGSPLYVGDALAGVCQGRASTGDVGCAVVVPLTDESIVELRNVQNRRRVRWLGILGCVVAIGLALIAVTALRSSTSFALAGIHVEEGSRTVEATNGQKLTFRPAWSRTFETRIFTSALISETPGGSPTHVGVGTTPKGTVDGAFVLLNEQGREVWRYSVPQGECIYEDEGEVYDLFLATHIVPYDLEGDGEQEILVVFVHNNFYPTKLMIFEMSGEILAEYWHPGYFRTIAIGSVGDPSSDPMIVVSASNNRIQDTWWHAQTLFAFDGLHIAGQAPPYTGTRGRDADRESGTELWYRVLQNIDGEVLRAKCREIDIGDYTGDGSHEIRAATTDGRFYYLNEVGETLWIDVGDRWLQNFGGIPAPELTVLSLDQE